MEIPPISPCSSAPSLEASNSLNMQTFLIQTSASVTPTEKEEWGCSTLGSALLIRSFEAMQKAKAGKKASVAWYRQYKEAWDTYIEGICRLYLYLSATEIGNKIPKDSAALAQIFFSKARTSLQNGFKHQVPQEIVAATKALDSIEQILNSDPSALLKPPGLKFNDPDFLIESMHKKISIFWKTFNDAPLICQSLWRDKKKKIIKLIDQYEALYQNASPPSPSQKVKQFVFLAQSIQTVYQEILAAASARNETHWPGLCNIFILDALDEGHRFITANECFERKMKGKDLLLIATQLRDIIHASTIALDLIDTDHGTDHDPEAQALIEVSKKVLKTFNVAIEKWTKMIEETPPPSDEPVVLATYFFMLDGLVDNDFNQVIVLLQAFFNKNPDATYLYDRAKIMQETWILTNTLLYGAPIDHSEFTLPPSSTPDPHPPHRVRQKDRSPPSPLDRNSPALPAPTPFQTAISEAKNIFNIEPLKPNFDTEFRKHWRLISEANLDSAFSILIELEQRPPSYDRLWSQIEKLSIALEAFLERTLLHFPFGSEGVHFLKSPPSHVGGKPLHQAHNLEAFAKALLDNAQTPLNVRGLILRDLSLLQTLSRSHVIARYPASSLHELTEKNTSPAQKLLKFVRNLELATSYEELGKTLTDDYIKPAIRFMEDMTQLLNGGKVEGLDLTHINSPLPTLPSSNVENQDILPFSTDEIKQAETPKSKPSFSIYNTEQALRALTFIEMRIRMSIHLPIEGEEVKHRQQLRNDSLRHSLILVKRIREKFETNRSLQIDLHGSLDLIHTLMKELYTAALAHTPVFSKGRHYLDLIVPKTSHPLSFEQDLSILDDICQKVLFKKGQHSPSLARGSPSQFGWPSKAHLFLTYFSGLEATSTHPQSNILYMLLKQLSDRQKTVEEMEPIVDHNIRFQALEFASTLVHVAFSVD